MEANPADILAFQIGARYPNPVEQAAPLAALRRAGNSAALGATLLRAAESNWPETASDSWRHLACELFELAESCSRRIAGLVDHLTNREPHRILAGCSRRFERLIKLLDDVLRIASSVHATEDPDPGLIETLAVRLRECSPLAPSLARLIIDARARLEQFPLAQRIRVVTVTDRGHISTLGIARQKGGHEFVHATSRDDTRAVVIAALQDLPTGAVARLLDDPDECRIGGPSFGLPTAIIVAAMKTGASVPSDILATGGRCDVAINPWAPLLKKKQLDLKLAAAMEFSRLRATPVRRFVIADDEDRPTAITDSSIQVVGVGRSNVASQLLDLPKVIAGYRTALQRTADVDVDAYIPRAVERRIEEFISSGDAFTHGEMARPAIALAVSGPPGAGKRTLCDVIAARTKDPTLRRLAFVSPQGMTALDAAKQLCAKLGLDEPTTLADLCILQERVQSAWRNEIDTVVWFHALHHDSATAVRELEEIGELERVLGTRFRDERTHDHTTSSLRIVITMGQRASERVRGELARRSWDSIDLELDDADLDNLAAIHGKPNLFATCAHLRPICRLAAIWSHPESIIAAKSALDLAAVISGRLRDEAEVGDAMTRVLAQIASTARTNFEPSASDRHLLNTGALIADCGSVRFSDHFTLAQELSFTLASRPDSRDPELVAVWLKCAREDRDFEVLEESMVIAVTRNLIGERMDLLRALLAYDDLGVVRLGVRITIDLAKWAHDRSEDAWNVLRHVLERADQSIWLVVLEVAGLDPGADTIVGLGLRHIRPAVRVGARLALQQRARQALSVASAADAATKVVSPIVTQASELVVFAPRWSLRRWFRRLHFVAPFEYLAESCLVVLTETTRGGAVRGSRGGAAWLDRRALYNACSAALADLLRQLPARSARVRLLFSRLARPIVISNVIAQSLWGKLKTLRSHNPYKQPHKVQPFFRIKRVDRRNQLGRFVAFVSRDPSLGDPVAELETLVTWTLELYGKEAFAFAPTNTIVEAAWGTLTIDRPEGQLDNVIRKLERCYAVVSPRATTHAYAQSCLFTMFRLLWRVPRERAEPHFHTFARLVEDWHGREGGKYRTAANHSQEVQYLFRYAALAWRFELDPIVFRDRIEMLNPPGERSLLDEITHLGEEFGLWEDTFPLYAKLEERLVRAGIEIRDINEGKKIRRRMTSQIDLDARRGDTPMLGLSLAFEEAVFMLLTFDDAFRQLYARWLRAALELRSFAKWQARALEELHGAVFK